MRKDHSKVLFVEFFFQPHISFTLLFADTKNLNIQKGPPIFVIFMIFHHLGTLLVCLFVCLFVNIFCSSLLLRIV